MMTPERWRRVQELCHALEGVPGREREVRLAALEPDESVRRETLVLLDALQAEAAYTAPSVAAPPLPSQDVIGGVRILERLGAGGSGEVFRGIRMVHGTEQVVAVKRFHARPADAAAAERFAREQRMLAALTHPDIVRLLDAGVGEDGRPYLVMDLVAGRFITAFSDDEGLTVRRRLVLFLAVCDAVQSAHQQLVVHLDLKPGNILVTADGRPKLLDFGTAKLVDPLAGMTRTEPLTLQYASPERLRGESVSVACDVYSLGLILFELLSGAWPFRRRDSLVAVAERASGALDVLPLSRVVTADAAGRRSTTLARLRTALAGDLDAIAARALAHDPRDRYASVMELADDIRFHLDGQPVRARPLGVGYRLGKFVRRRAWEVSSVALVIVALAAAATSSLAQARSARQAADRAQAQNRFLTSLFSLAGYDAASESGMTVRQLLALADRRVSPMLSTLPDVAADVERTLAYGLLAQGAWDDARALVDRAHARTLAAGDAPREASIRALSSYLSYVSSQPAEAMAEARVALELWRAHRADFDPDLEVFTLMTAGQTLAFANPPSAEPAPYLEACLTLTEGQEPFRYTVRPGCLYVLAAVRVNAESRLADAEVLLDEAVALQRADPTLESQLAASLQLLGLVRRLTGRFAEDEAAQREAYDILRRLVGDDNLGALWQRAVWATSLVGAGRADDGYREAMRVLEEARRRYPARGTNMLWTPLSAASTAACFLEKMDECERFAAEALETLGPSPAPNDARAATARGLLGLALSRRGASDEARPLLRAAIDGVGASGRTSLFLPAWHAALAAAAPPR